MQFSCYEAELSEMIVRQIPLHLQQHSALPNTAHACTYMQKENKSHQLQSNFFFQQELYAILYEKSFFFPEYSKLRRSTLNTVPHCDHIKCLNNETNRLHIVSLAMHAFAP